MNIIDLQAQKCVSWSPVCIALLVECNAVKERKRREKKGGEGGGREEEENGKQYQGG